MVALIGAGTVYRARDTTLERDLAIKVLPDLASQDRDRVLRVAREARALATLSHPNIAVIHGLEEVVAAPPGHVPVKEGSDLVSCTSVHLKRHVSGENPHLGTLIGLAALAISDRRVVEKLTKYALLDVVGFLPRPRA